MVEHVWRKFFIFYSKVCRFPDCSFFPGLKRECIYARKIYSAKTIPTKLKTPVSSLDNNHGTTLALNFRVIVYGRNLPAWLVMVTISFDVVSSWRQFLSVSWTSGTSVVGSMSRICTSTMRTRWQTDPLTPTTPRKAYSNLPLSFAAQFTSTKRSLHLVFLIPRILTPN